MKRSIISILVAGLFAVTAVWAAEEDVKANPKPVESSQSRAGEPSKTDETNQSKDQQAKHDRGTANFKKADKDNDGTLDRKEAKDLPRVSKNFNAIDTDHDGTVSLAEVHTYMQNHPAKSAKK